MPIDVITATATLHVRRRVLIPALAASMVALATACGGSAPPAATPGSDAPATTVTVTMTDFTLALDTESLAPGSYIFHAVNSGQAGHALEVEGPGIEEQRTPVVQPGQSADLSVTLPAGTFEMYCPVGNHKEMGMELDLTVGGAGSPASEPAGGGGY